MQYIKLLEAVEEGLELVDLNYQERNYGSGDKLLKDLVGAFVPFNSSNMTMRSIFVNDPSVLSELQKFQDLLEQVLHLNTILHDEEEKTQFINEFFLPSYKQWKNHMYHQLKVYN